MVPSAYRVTVRLVVCLSGTAVTNYLTLSVQLRMILVIRIFHCDFIVYYYILGVHQLIDWPSLVYSPRHSEIWVLSASHVLDN